MVVSSSSTARVVCPRSSHEAGGYEVRGFQPADAKDIPRAFEAVYGKDYLYPKVYDAAAFADFITSGDQISFVACDAEGDFAGHIALVYSAPNRHLVEVAQGIVLPAHRKSGIFRRLLARAVDFARKELGCQAIFGTALTNHSLSQKVLAESGFRDLGLEVDYVPERMLAREGATGPAATLVQALDFGQPAVAPCYLPAPYASWFLRLLNDAAVRCERQVVVSSRLLGEASESAASDMPRFDMSRLLVRRAGFDFAGLVDDLETAAKSAGRRSVQVLVSLGARDGAAAIEHLRAQGYACGGLLPGYLEGGRHVAIMYKSFAMPNFDGICMHAPAAERLLSNVEADWRRAQDLSAQPGAVTLTTGRRTKP